MLWYTLFGLNFRPKTPSLDDRLPLAVLVVYPNVVLYDDALGDGAQAEPHHNIIGDLVRGEKEQIVKSNEPKTSLLLEIPNVSLSLQF